VEQVTDHGRDPVVGLADVPRLADEQHRVMSRYRPSQLDRASTLASNNAPRRGLLSLCPHRAPSLRSAGMPLILILYREGREQHVDESVKSGIARALVRKRALGRARSVIPSADASR
jgi:hypothetical protein